MSLAATSQAASPRQGGFRRFWRALKQLLLEVAGAIFAVIGLTWLNMAFRSWTRDMAHWLVGAAIAFALLFFFFAVTSFRRAKRV